MINIDLLDFIRSGDFGPVKVGLTYTELAEVLRCDGADMSDDVTGQSLAFGCLCVGFWQGRVNCITLFLDEIYPRVCDSIRVSDRGLVRENRTLVEILEILRTHDTRLTHCRESLRAALEMKCDAGTVPVGKHSKLLFERRADELYWAGIVDANWQPGEEGEETV